MKLVVSLLPLLVLLPLCGCNTPNTRRDMYSPTEGNGYWKTRYHHGKEAADASLTKTPARNYTPPATPAPRT